MQLGFDYVALKELFPDSAPLLDEPRVVGLEKNGQLLDSVGTLPLHAIDLNENLETHQLKYAGKAAFQTVSEPDLRAVIEEALALPNYADQKRLVRAKLTGQFGVKKLPSDHFLLRDLTNGWWSRSLPSSFAVYLRLQDPEQDLMLIFKKGQLSECRAPDFSSLAKERQGEIEARVAFLSSRFGVKVHAITISERNWMRISNEAKPWKPFADMLRSGEISLHPFKWRMAFCLSLRAFFGI